MAAALTGRGDELLPAFDQANRLYEQGQFTNAAAAYQRLIDGGHGSATLYFNLGNAWFKAGQRGRAVAAYRCAQTLAPRDPNTRFNLEFVRQQVTGNQTAARPFWQRLLGSLTLNEWTVLTMCGGWLWFALLALREARPALRGALRGYTAAAGVGAGLVAVCLAASARQATQVQSAVIVVSSASVHRGPLSESQVTHELLDGSEVTVLDEKQTGATQWVQVRDELGRSGWVRREKVEEVGSKTARSGGR